MFIRLAPVGFLVRGKFDWTLDHVKDCVTIRPHKTPYIGLLSKTGFNTLNAGCVNRETLLIILRGGHLANV